MKDTGPKAEKNRKNMWKCIEPRMNSQYTIHSNRKAKFKLRVKGCFQDAHGTVKYIASSSSSLTTLISVPSFNKSSTRLKNPQAQIQSSISISVIRSNDRRKL